VAVRFVVTVWLYAVVPACTLTAPAVAVAQRLFDKCSDVQPTRGRSRRIGSNPRQVVRQIVRQIIHPDI